MTEHMAGTAKPALDKARFQKRSETDGPGNSKTMHTSPMKAYPVDKGWAWIILISSFGIHFLSIGYLRSFGLLFVEFQNKFGSSSAMTSVVSGVQFLSYSLATFLVVNMMMKRLSIRLSCLIGSFLEALGIILNGFVPNITLLILTQGVIFGTGQALLHCPTLIILSEYFDKKRAIATVIATCGVSVGGIALPQLTHHLIDTFGLSGGLLLLAAIIFQQAVLASLMTPPSDYSFAPTAETVYFIDDQDKSTTENRQKAEERHTNRVNAKNLSSINKNSALVYNAASVGKRESENLLDRGQDTTDKETHFTWEKRRQRKLDLTSENCPHNNTQSLPKTRTSREGTLSHSTCPPDTAQNTSQKQQTVTSRQRSRNDSEEFEEEHFLGDRSYTNDGSIFARNSQRKPSLNDTMSAVISTSSVDLYGSLHSFTLEASSHNIYHSPSTEEHSDMVEQEVQQVKTKRRCHMPSVVRTPSFWIVLVFFASAGTASALPPIFLPPLANEKRMIEHAAFLLMMSAFTEMAGRVIPGLILHFGFMRPSTVLIVPMAACGTVYQFTSFFNDFGTLLTMAVLSGLFTGAFWAVQSLVVIEVFGMKKLGPILGFYNIVSGLSVALSNPVGGLLRDLSGTYATTFHYFGAMYYMAVLMMILIQFCKGDDNSNTESSRSEKSPEHTEQDKPRVRNRGALHSKPSNDHDTVGSHKHSPQSPVSQHPHNSFSKSSTV